MSTPDPDPLSSSPSHSKSTIDTFAARLFNSPLNTTITRLHRIVSTSKGTEALLALVSHSSILLYSQLHRLLELNLRVIAERTANDVSKTLQPGETMITSLPLPAITRRLADIHDGSKALEHTIEDVRAFARLFSLLGVWRLARKMYYQGPQDLLLKNVIWVQILVDTVACATEAPAYLASKGILRGWSKEDKSRYGRFSARCFIVHLVLEFVKLWRKSVALQEVENKSEAKDDRSTRHREREHWWQDVYITSAYSPLALHWGLPGTYVSELWIGVLGTIAGYFEFKEAWEAAIEAEENESGGSSTGQQH